MLDAEGKPLPRLIVVVVVVVVVIAVVAVSSFVVTLLSLPYFESLSPFQSPPQISKSIPF